MKDLNLNDAYKLYRYYLAVKLYLKGSYDINKYRGRLNTNRAAFEKRSDAKLFASLARKKNAYDMVLANLIEDDNIHVSNLIDSRYADHIYNEWIKREESRSHFLKMDLQYLYDDFDENFIVNGDEMPHLLALYYESKIGLDTLALMNSVVNYIGYWDKEIQDTILYPKISSKIKKSRTFFKYKTDDYARLVKNNYRKRKDEYDRFCKTNGTSQQSVEYQRSA